MPAPWVNRLLWSTQGGGLQNAGALPNLNANGNSGPLDVGAYRELWLEVILTSFTGGTTPSFAPEWDALDDAASPNVFPLWKPASVTAATKWLEALGVGIGAAPTIAGWTVGSVVFPFGSFGQLAWTITGAPTAVAWQAFLYAK